MTNREFLNAVIASNINDEVTQHATEELNKLDVRNAKRVERNAEKRKENEPIKVKILELLTSEPTVSSEISKVLDISIPKASAMCRQLVEEERCQVTDVKIPKKGIQKGYFVV